MRIDGFPSQSYPIKRKPRKGSVPIDEAVDESQTEPESAPQSARKTPSSERISQLPVRTQDMIFQRGMSKNAASALASYLTTQGFVDWEIEVMGLDLYI